MRDISELKDLVRGIITVIKAVKGSLEDDGKINVTEGLKIGITAVKEGMKVDFKDIPEEVKDLSFDEMQELYLLVLDESDNSLRKSEVEGFVSLILKLIKK